MAIPPASMTPADEAVMSRARAARASLYATVAMVLDMERTGHIGATAAIALVRKEYDHQRSFIDAEEDLVHRLVEELKANHPSNESSLIDDVPLV